MMLPRDVQRVVKPSGKAYYYYAPHRGSAGAGKRVALGSDTLIRNSGASCAKQVRLLPLATARYRS